MATQESLNSIAVIGMSGEFPHSSTLSSFWENIKAGRELISFFTDEECLASGVPLFSVKDSRYIKAKGFLEDADCFDADFFGYSRREAELLDPQQRRLLEWAWIALENAGYDPDQYEGSIGVFACSSLSSYFYFNLYPYLYGSSSQLQDEMLMVLGNEKDFVATRISYKMNLKGPSKSIQTACSSSLVAVHDACQSLLNYECDMAIAGGASITFPQKAGYTYSKEGIMSPDGHCRAFDHLAAGTLVGNGGGIVVLKRLQDALEDGDTIIATIKGSYTNNDGAEKIGYTAPSIKGQSHAIIGAQLAAQVSPETITYVECHGTATQLGDPIEIVALTSAFRKSTEKKQFCAIGSVKTNMGHLDAAAGVAGLIKIVLSLQARQIPPSLHFTQPNPKIDFANSPFYVNRELTPWNSQNAPLRAGVSSFGMGGTNAHVILEEAPLQRPQPSTYSSFLLPFSAKDKRSLQHLLRQFLKKLPTLIYPLADIAFTLQIGRKRFDERAVFICSTKEEAAAQINLFLEQVIPPPLPMKSPWYEAAETWLNGGAISWKNYYKQEKRRRVPLPTYPFAKTHYFISPKPIGALPQQNHVTQSNISSSQDIEKRMIEIWEKALKSYGITPQANFFDLGGDSLLALEITDQIRQIFLVEVGLRDLFDNPTVDHLSLLIKELMDRALLQPLHSA